MSDSRSANTDPSMDDILASIRKIISDDEARAQAAGQPARPTAVSQSERRPEPAKAQGKDDVLLLTELIEDAKPAADGAAPPAPAPQPSIDPVRAAEMPQPSVSQPADALAGAPAVEATKSAFARLDQALQGSVPAPAAHDPGPTIGGSGKTMEDLVKEMLRPMLKDWLDRNLPAVVERYVEREIVRLTRR